MAASPKFKVHQGARYLASFKRLGDAILFARIMGGKSSVLVMGYPNKVVLFTCPPDVEVPLAEVADMIRNAYARAEIIAKTEGAIARDMP